MEIHSFIKASEAPSFLAFDGPNSFCFALKCRNCTALSVSTVNFNAGTNIGHALHNSSASDLSQHVLKVVASSPPLDTVISPAIPPSVRDALIDAYEAPRPRAKCMHFRSAIEFSLRSINVEAKSGDTLGAILAKARTNYALPEPLIELCNQVKAFGNWGIHWSETEIEMEDAEAAQKISEAIMLYLFELPALVEQAKERTDEAKDAHRSAAS